MILELTEGVRLSRNWPPEICPILHSQLRHSQLIYDRCMLHLSLSVYTGALNFHFFSKPSSQAFLFDFPVALVVELRNFSPMIEFLQV